jgi:hypothetical protein
MNAAARKVVPVVLGAALWLGCAAGEAPARPAARAPSSTAAIS